MFSLFKKKYTPPNQISLINLEKLKARLSSNPLLFTRPSTDFYNELFGFLNLDFIDKKNPIHQKFVVDLKHNIEKLSPYYGDILESAFKYETLDVFISKFNEDLKQISGVTFTRYVIIIYWYHLTLNLKPEIDSRNDKDLTANHESLISSIKEVSESLN